MSEPDNAEKAPEPAPAPGSQVSDASPTENEPSRATLLEQARQWLADDTIRQSARDRKVEFLKSKGLSEDEIEALMQESDPAPSVEQEVLTAACIVLLSHFRPNISLQDSSQPGESPSQPPIVTYPEFLLHPSQHLRPQPLVTASRLATALYSLTALSTLAYGAARFVARPMAEALVEAQATFWDGAKADVDGLVERLEGMVSEIPVELRADAVSATSKPAEKGREDVDVESSASIVSAYEDPTELFHRDIGTQTSTPTATAKGSRPSSPLRSTASETAAAQETEDLSEVQATRISALAASLRELASGVKGEADSLNRTAADLDMVRDRVAAIKYTVFRGTNDDNKSRTNNMTNGYGGNVDGDEVDRTRDAIRRVKGALLASRNFPAVPSVPVLGVGGGFGKGSSVPAVSGTT